MDILNIISVVNIFGFIFLMDYCVRKRRKINLPLIFYWVLFIALLSVVATVAISFIYGPALTTEQIEAFVTNLIGLLVAFLIIDLIIFFIAKFLYRKIPYISIFLGHETIALDEQEKKHMSKITIYTHEKPGSQEFEKIKSDVEKVAKENTSVDTLEVEKGTENITSRRKHKKNGGG